MTFRRSKEVNETLSRPLAFVFSGGTSLGSIQVGMLKAVLEAGITPDLLVGTSAGAINAAYMGQGFTAARLERLADIWRGLKMSDVFGRPKLSTVLRLLNGHGALTSPRGLEKLLQENLPRSHSSFAIQTAVAATDFNTGQPVILSLGDLVPNVMASAAIPMIFPAVTINDRTLVDGGVAAYVPLLQAETLRARSMVVFDAGYPCKLSRSPRSPVEKALHFITLMLYRQSLGLLSVLDRRLTVVYLPAPCPLDVPAYDFSQGTRLIQAAYINAQSFLSELVVRGPGVYGHPHIHKDPLEGVLKEVGLTPTI